MQATMARLAAVFGWTVGLGIASWAAGNGGPFLVKYPGGDPAAKGVLARLDPTLKPARESRLRVAHEVLTIEFQRAELSFGTTPVASVRAEYTIENPTDQEVSVDFGFPILRGIYLDPRSMLPRPDVQVSVDGKGVTTTVLTNSVIYGMVRQHARATIDRAIAADARLASLVGEVRRAAGVDSPSSAGLPPKGSVPGPAVSPEERARARDALAKYLAESLHWNDRDAALGVEYAGLDLGPSRVAPFDRPFSGFSGRTDNELQGLSLANLGVLAAIGEQKATQFFARLAGLFDPGAAPAYEAIFAAWGGDVRDRAVDLASGEVRLREYEAPRTPAKPPRFGETVDPTVYARLQYLDPRAKLTEVERASCQAVLKNLPVVFTFAPMNLLHYQATFPPRTTRLVTVTYRQHAFVDTRAPASYQIAYVLHPATLWEQFGPIHLTVRVPKGLACRASVGMQKSDVVGGPSFNEARYPGGTAKVEAGAYQTTLDKPAEKTGELFVAVDKAAWDARFQPGAKPATVGATK
ncbi:MAG: hypothetical protein NUV77_18650 [Thermoguttaceae bacterium]|jgi:hypothetical protein|nr:hypothetical protein [Thermoguttaceae bacterium]